MSSELSHCQQSVGHTGWLDVKTHSNNQLCGRERMKSCSNKKAYQTNKAERSISWPSCPFLLIFLVSETETSTLEGLELSLEDRIKVSTQLEQGASSGLKLTAISVHAVARQPLS